MQTVVGIRFKEAGKIYYFGPGTLRLVQETMSSSKLSEGLNLGRL